MITERPVFTALANVFPAHSSPHRDLELLGVDRARAVGVEQVEGLPNLLLLLLGQACGDRFAAFRVCRRSFSRTLPTANAPTIACSTRTRRLLFVLARRHNALAVAHGAKLSRSVRCSLF